MTRSLSIIPIVHSETDLGQLAEHVRAQIGDHAWADKQRAVAAIWTRIAAWSDETDAAGLLIFQDGLPDDPSAPRIVDELAAKGSMNHLVLKRLIERGAVVVGTESPELLLREYESARASADGAEAGRHPDPRDAQRAAALLDRRDRYIASTIDASIAEGQRGVLFIGMLHDVAAKLPGDIRTSYPLGTPQAPLRHMHANTGDGS